jgi:hypothetical protein
VPISSPSWRRRVRVVMNEIPMPRHIAQRRQYDHRRYARHLSQQELNRRLRDVIINMLHVGADAKIGPGEISDTSVVWWEKWTHMLEEMQLRHGPYPAGFTRDILHSEPFPDLASELAGKAARRTASLGLTKGDVFIKFGKRTYMERLFERGAFRLQPASFFARKDHNGAVRDDELSLEVALALSRDDIVKLVKNPQDVPLDAPDQRVNVLFRSPTDFWLYCVTNSVEPRLFVDFDADACVIIRDKAAFTVRLAEAASAQLPGTRMHSGPATYIDPLLPKEARVFVPFAKHFGYSYQEEHRFCWLPSTPAQELAFADVEVGALRGLAELIVL